MKFKKLPWLIVGSIVLIAAIVALVVGLYIHHHKSSSSNTYKFTALGVQVSLPPELKGLTSDSQKSSNSSARLTATRLYLPNYTSLADKCIGSTKDTQSFATLVKLSGSAPKSASKGPTLLKQFSSFYIIDLGGSLPAKAPCKDTITTSQMASLSAKLNTALNQAFSSATTIK